MKIKQLLAYIILCSFSFSLFGCFGGGKKKEQARANQGYRTH